MLTVSESGLTATQHSDIQSLTDAPIYQIVAERYNLSFTEVSDESRTVGLMDACVSGSYLVRAYFSGGDLYIERSTDGITWTNEHTISSSIDSTVAPSFATSGNNIRCFYYDGSDVVYVASTDNGDTWGAAQTVGTQGNVSFLAAVSTTKIHVCTFSHPNGRLHYWEDDGGWSKTDSNIYWPHEPDSMDAITVGDKDLIVVATYLQKRYEDTRQGIVGIFQDNGRWGEHFNIDVVDEGSPWLYRKNVRLSSNGGYYLLTFYGSDGTEDNPIADRCLTRSKDGRWWEKRRFVVCDETGSAPILVLDNDAFVVGTGKTFRSDATRLVGYNPSSGDPAYLGDITGDIVQGFRSRMGKMRQTNLVLGDPDESYVSGAFSDLSEVLLDIQLGWWDSGGASLVVPYSIEYVDFQSVRKQGAERLLQISSRDIMSRLVDETKKADHYIEWYSQLLGRDKFRDETDTGYGGLRHTATDGGHFETKNERLKLKTSNEIHQAHNTFSTTIANGFIRSGIMYATDSNNEIVGLTFRCEDFENYYRAAYEDSEGEICLRRVTDDVAGDILAQTTGLSWSAGTQYYLMVEFRYKLVTVYYSTDGVNWTQGFQYEDTSGAASATEMIEGYVGYIGQGYSDEDTDPPDPDPPDYPPGDYWPPDLYGAENLMVFDASEGCWLLKSGAGEWLERNDTLTGTDDDDEQGGWDPWWFTPYKANSIDVDRSYLCRGQVGAIYKSEDGGQTWTDCTPNTNPPNSWGDTTAPTAATVTYRQRVSSIHVNGWHCFLVTWQEPDSGNDLWRSWLLYTNDDHDTHAWVSFYGIGDTTEWHFGSGDEGWVGSVQSGSFTAEWDGTVGHTAVGSLKISGSYFIHRWNQWEYTFASPALVTGTTELSIWRNQTTSSGDQWIIVNYSVSGSVNYSINDSTDWEQITFDLSAYAGETITSIRYYLRVQSALAWIDDVILTASETRSVKALWANVDSEDGSVMWLTTFRDDVLYLQKWTITAGVPSFSAEYSLGGCTEAQLGGTYIAYPMTPYADKDVCYVYGYMNDPQGLGNAQVIMTDDGGSTFSSVESGWGSDICAAFHASQPLSETRTLAAVRNNGDGTSEVYHGVGSLSKVADLDFEVNVDGFTINNKGHMAAGSNTDQSVMVRYAESPYTSWQDITFNLPTTGEIKTAVYV